MNIKNNYSVGAYIRLSREDEDKNTESESIKNQKSLIFQYAKENHLNIEEVYIDDGYSGTNFDRPEFKRLISDIESKKINLVITKDMSRLGRDYIGTGELIEKYFPEHNVRYIAITDNIDTLLDNSNNDIAPFKAIMNDMYAKDISKKIKSSLRAKQKEGKWVGGRAPFGYEKDPGDKNHLIKNEDKAKIVRRIYYMFLDNHTISSIANILTKEGIKTPAEYNYENYNKIASSIWNPKTIRDILTNRTYTGDLVQNKRNKVNYKVKTIINNDPTKYIIVENTHEPIIDKQMFSEVQKRIPKNKGRIEKKEKNLLDGLLYCGECGHRISITPRRKQDNHHYTICNYYRTNIKLGLCTMHSNNYDILEKKIINAIIYEIQNSINKTNIQKKVSEKVCLQKDGKEKKISELKREIQNINNNLDELYIDKLNKKITNEQYKRIKDKLEKELLSKRKQYMEIKNIKIDDNNNLINDYYNIFFKFESLSRELLINIIERIDILEDKTINIKVCFTKNSISKKDKDTFAQ